MIRRTHSLFALIPIVALAFFSSTTRADNWPQWRGANLDGISGEKDLPVTWSKTENIAWRLELPGPGGSTPIVWDDKVFVTSEDKGSIVLICVGTDGKQQWKQTLTSGNRNVRGDEGNSAAPSAATDGKHVWAVTANNGTIGCFTLDGKEVWRKDLQEEYGKFRIAFGMTSTPVLDDGRLYFQLIHGEGNPDTREATIVCLNGADGTEIWKQGRPSDAIKECEHSYASPTLYRDGDQKFLVTHGADYVIAHRLSDGAELWRCGDLNPKGSYNPTLRFVASPVCAPGLIVVPSAKNGPVFGLRPGLKGDVTDVDSAYAWKRMKGTPDVPSPVIHDGLVYLCRENGNLVCVDAKTGDTLYEERTTRNRHRASPVVADGKIYTTSRSGVITVAKTGREFEILAQNELGEEVSASPAVAGGRIYVRSFGALYAIGK